MSVSILPQVRKESSSEHLFTSSLKLKGHIHAHVLEFYTHIYIAEKTLVTLLGSLFALFLPISSLLNPRQNLQTTNKQDYSTLSLSPLCCSGGSRRGRGYSLGASSRGLRGHLLHFCLSNDLDILWFGPC